MGDGMTVLVALVALCAANMVLIWQVATLSNSVDEVRGDMHAAARWLARMEARRLSAAGRQGGDGDEDQRRTAGERAAQPHGRPHRPRDDRAAEGR